MLNCGIANYSKSKTKRKLLITTEFFINIKKTLKRESFNWLGLDVEVRTFNIAKWLIDNIKNIDFITFNQNLKAIMI